MAVSFACPCGQHLEIDDQYAGQDVSCPTCGQTVTAPRRRAKVVKALTPPPGPPTDRPSGETRRRDGRSTPRPDDEEEDDDDRPRRRPRPVDDDEPLPKKKRKKAEEQNRSLEGRIFSGNVVGGAIAMLIAVVWFVVGIVAADRIFFYPPILFGIGLVGLVRGLIQSDDR